MTDKYQINDVVRFKPITYSYHSLTFSLFTFIYCLLSSPLSLCLSLSHSLSHSPLSLSFLTFVCFSLSLYLSLPHSLSLPPAFSHSVFLSFSLTLSLSLIIGIGESKHGLPLGRLNVRVVSIKFTKEELILFGDNPIVRLRISIKGTSSKNLFSCSFNFILSILSLPDSLSLCLSVSLPLSLCLFLPLPLSLCPSLSLFLSLCLSVCLSISLFLPLPLSLCPSLSLFLSLSLSVCLSVSRLFFSFLLPTFFSFFFYRAISCFLLPSFHFSSKGTRAGGVSAGPPVGPRSYSKTLVPLDGVVPLNQSIGA